MAVTSRTVLKQKKKNLCRGEKYHFPPQFTHSTKRDFDYCKYCNAYTEIFQKKCSCCTKSYAKHLTTTWINHILNAGVRQHKAFIREYCEMPIREPFYVKIKYKDTVYQIQIKYLALYLEEIPKEDKLRILKKKLRIFGFRFSYPELEEMDETCVSCGEKLTYNLEGQIFCKNCNGVH